MKPTHPFMLKFVVLMVLVMSLGAWETHQNFMSTPSFSAVLNGPEKL